MIDVVICIGRLLHHLRGAWQCSCQLAVAVNATVDVGPIVQDILDDGLGL